MNQNGVSIVEDPKYTTTTSSDDQRAENGDYELTVRRTNPNDDETTTRHAGKQTSTEDGLLCTTSGYKILIIGQLLSFLLAAGGAAQATLHLECSLSAPTFTSTFIYLLLSLHLIPLYRQGRQWKQGQQATATNRRGESPRVWWCGILPLYASPWVYLGIAFLDVEANFVMMLAYRYTTITSIALFDSLAIPSAMILSWILLKRRYTPIHFVGVGVCTMGVFYNVLADYESSSDMTEYPHKMWGDVLAIAGGIIYGVNNVLAETCVRNLGGPYEYLGMNGIFGLLISIVQVTLVEREEIAAFFFAARCSIRSGLGLLLAYALTGTMAYVGTSRFLSISEAAFLNLSFLTGGFWCLGFSIIAERIVPSPLFFVALTMTISGVVIYDIGPSPIVDEEIQYEIVGPDTETELSTASSSCENALT